MPNPLSEKIFISPTTLVGYDEDSEEYRHVNIDSAGNLSSRGRVWNPDTLAWEAQTQEMSDRYKISDMDDSADPAYFGFLDEDANWYILRLTNSGEARYCAGTSGYATAWTNRATHSYGLYSDTF